MKQCVGLARWAAHGLQCRFNGFGVYLAHQLAHVLQMAFEGKLMAAIHVRFSIPPEPPQKINALIKRADKVSAFLEATQLAGFEQAEAAKFFGRPRGLAGFPTKYLTLKPLPAEEAGKRFVAKFRQLR